MAGLLDNYLDPAAASQAGLFEGLTRLGAALTEAGRPRLVLREGFGPGLLGGLAAGFGGFGQGMREGRRNALAEQTQNLATAREVAAQEAMSATPDEQLSPMGRQYRGLLAQMPERARAALPFIGADQRGTFLAAALRPGERQNVVIPPGGTLANSENGSVLFQAPYTPQRAPLPGAYDHIRVLPNGEIVDLRLLGGAGGQPPAAPATPGGAAPPLSPAVGLPAPGRTSSLAPPVAPPGDTLPPPLPATVTRIPPDASPAGGAPMLTPQPGDVTTAQGAPPAAPMSPGTLRAAPPPEWEQLTGPNVRMYNLPDLPQGQFYQRNRRTGEIKIMNRDGVTINNNPEVRAETAEAGARGKALADEEQTVRTEAAGAANTIDAMRQVRAIGAPTGRLAPAKEAIGGWLEAMGMGPQSRLVRDAQSIQAFNQAASSAVLSAQLQQKGVATEGDARRIEQSWAQLRNTPGANDFILRAAEAQATRLMERDEFYQNWRQQPGENGKPRNTVDGAGAAWRRMIRETPLVTRLEGGEVIFFNEYMANAQANSVPREEAMRIWRERAR